MARAAFRASLRDPPLSIAAMNTDATSRLRSHSHGAMPASSKSLRSKSSERSGEAKKPKFEMWASPLDSTVIPEFGVAAKSAAIVAAVPR